LEYQTGELPLMPGKAGDLTPTPRTAPQAAPVAPPAKHAATTPAAAQAVPAGPAKHTATTAIARAVARPKRSFLVPSLCAAGVIVAGGLGLLYLRSGDSAGRAGPAQPAAVKGPVSVAIPAPSREVEPAAPAAPAAREPQAPVAGAPDEFLDEPETGTGAPAAEPRSHAKRKPPVKPPPGRKKQAQVAVRSPAPAAVPAAAPAAKPPVSSERPLVAIAPSPAVPPTAPEQVRPATPAAPPVSSNAELPPLDESGVEATFARSMKRFDACMAAARANEPGAPLGNRTVTLTMTVNPSGKVLYPTLDDAELSAADLGKCLKREAGKIQFPPFGGDPIRVRRPITLR
jgi:hypothetical protein